MKRRGIKCILTALCLFFACIFSACAQHVFPETYGEWEGNYIYRANAKTTTTGEEYTKLVEEIEMEGQVFEVTHCSDYAFLEEDMYMILRCKKQEDDGNSQHKYSFVKYDIQDKTQTLLHTDFHLVEDGETVYYELRQIYQLTGEYIYLLAEQQKTLPDGRKQAITNVWVTLNRQGELIRLQEELSLDWERVDTQCFLYHEYSLNVDNRFHQLYCKDGFSSQPILVKEWEKSNERYYRWEYVNQKGARGILLFLYDQGLQHSGRDKLLRIEFFNLENQTLQEVAEVNRYCSTFTDEYIKLFDFTTIDYREHYFSEEKEKEVATNSALYQFIYEDTGVRLEKRFDFAKESYITLYAFAEGKLLYRRHWWESPQGCESGGIRYEHIERELSTGLETQYSFSEMTEKREEYKEIHARMTGVTCGIYTYYLLKGGVITGMWGAHATACFLKRYNSETGETETLQAWWEDGGDTSSESVKYSQEFWFTSSIENDEFIVAKH